MSKLTTLLFPLYNLHLNRILEPHLKEDNRRYDKFMLYLILIHWFTATFITAITYETYLFGFIAGGVLMLFSAAVYMRCRGTRTFRLTAALALIGFSAIFIQQHLGRIELHFHVFVALAFLTIYKDYFPLITGALLTILHHLFFNVLQAADATVFGMPVLVFNYGCGFEIVAIHAFFVIFGSVTLFYITILRQISFEKMIRTSARLAYLNDNLEKEVAVKTRKVHENMLALKESNQQLIEAKNRAVMANEARSNFISSVSHELRTPLNSIINFTDMVIEDFDEMFENIETRRENKEFLGRVLKNSKHLLALINDILEFTKAEAGKLSLEIAPTNINAVVRSAYSNCQGIVGRSPLDYRLDTVEEELIAAVDKRRFFQILLNLISNAIKFTSEGFVSVKTYAKEKTVLIEVEDSGRGIPAENLESIFDPFEQVTQYDAGTGLGLVIVKKLCSDMNIKLNVESVFGKGTKFILILDKAERNATDKNTDS